MGLLLLGVGLFVSEMWRKRIDLIGRVVLCSTYVRPGFWRSLQFLAMSLSVRELLFLGVGHVFGRLPILGVCYYPVPICWLVPMLRGRILSGCICVLLGVCLHHLR